MRVLSSISWLQELNQTESDYIPLKPCIIMHGYIICSGWFEEFCIAVSDVISDGNSSSLSRIGPICNYHCKGNEPVITEKYWQKLVEKFGLQLKKDGEVVHSYSDTGRVFAKRPVNTRSIEGDFSDEDLLDFFLANT